MYWNSSSQLIYTCADYGCDVVGYKPKKLLKLSLVGGHKPFPIDMYHLIHWAVVQRIDMVGHFADVYADVEPLHTRGGVQRVEDLLHLRADVACGVEDAKRHEAIGRRILVDRRVPGFTQHGPSVFYLHPGQHQVAAVLGGSVDHPDAVLVGGQVQVCVRVAGFEVAVVAFGVDPAEETPI